MQKKILILGMGNTILGDDGAGIKTAEILQNTLPENQNINIDTTCWGGLRIVDLLSGFDTAIIIDALKTGNFRPGQIHQLNYKDLIHSVRMVSFHDVNFATAVELAKELDIPMPTEILVYGIEIERSDVFKDELTPKVKAAVEICAELIFNLLEEKFDLYHQSEMIARKFLQERE